MSTDFPETLGDRIRFIRSSRGWSQSHLAELAGMKKAQLSRYEVGASKPRPEVLHRIAAALGVSPRWLEDPEEAINDHEVPEERGTTVPVSPELMEKLLEFATLSGRTLTEAMDFIANSVLDDIRKKYPEASSSLRPKDRKSRQ